MALGAVFSCLQNNASMGHESSQWTMVTQCQGQHMAVDTMPGTCLTLTACDRLHRVRRFVLEAVTVIPMHAYWLREATTLAFLCVEC